MQDQKFLVFVLAFVLNKEKEAGQYVLAAKSLDNSVKK